MGHGVFRRYWHPYYQPRRTIPLGVEGAEAEQLLPSAVDGTAEFGAPELSSSYELNPVVIDGSEEFGTPALLGQYELDPAGLDGLGEFGTPTLLGQYELVPAAEDALQSVLPPNLTSTFDLLPAAHDGVEEFGSPTLLGSFTLSAAAEEFLADILAPTLTVGAVILGPTAFAAAAEFVAPSLASGATIVPSAFDGLTSLLTPTVDPGGVELAPAAHDSLEVALSPTLTSLLVVEPGAFDALTEFGTPELNLQILPSALVAAAEFGVPELTNDNQQFLLPTGFDGASSIPVPTVEPGIVTLAPVAADHSAEFGSPIFSLFVGPSAFDGNAEFGSPTIAAVHLIAPPPVAAAGEFGAPVLNLSIQPTAIGFSASFGNPIIAFTGQQFLLPPAYNGIAFFSLPTVALASLPDEPQASQSMLPPYGRVVEPPLWFRPFVLRRQWTIPVKWDAWLLEPARLRVLQEMARVTRDWANWHVIERRTSPSFSNSLWIPRLVLQALRIQSSGVYEIAVDFAPDDLYSLQTFSDRLVVATTYLAAQRQAV